MPFELYSSSRRWLSLLPAETIRHNAYLEIQSFLVSSLCSYCDTPITIKMQRNSEPFTPYACRCETNRANLQGIVLWVLREENL